MHLAAIQIYPLKSAAGLDLDACDVGVRGLRDDRRWMAVDELGRFVTGRQHGELVLIRAQPDGDGLRLSAPGMPALHVPPPAADAPRMQATVWGDTVDAVRAGDAADAWLSDYLRLPLRLVRMDARSRRAVDRAYAQDGDEVAFADGYPLLAISQSALDALNARIAARQPTRPPLPMARFRPNLTIADADAHAEDRWRRVRIGAIEFDAVKRCTRCVFTTVDPASGSRDEDGEPLRTLKDYRRTPAGIVFGMNLIARGSGVLRVGDAVEALA